MPFSDIYQSLILNSVIGQVAFTPPTGIYIGLSDTSPEQDFSGFNEPPAGSGYSRVQVANDLDHWTTSVTGDKNNSVSIVFPPATGPWGTQTHFGLFDSDSLSGATGILWGALNVQKNINLDQEARFTSPDLLITLN